MLLKTYTYLGDKMKIGDIVTRKKYNNDIIFKIVDIDNDIYYLKGVNVRLYADAPLDDLEAYDSKNDIEEENVFLQRIYKQPHENRDEYFYLPGKILHIDADKDYLNRCLNYYEKMNIAAIGFNFNEKELKDHVYDLLTEYNPNILVITGHDAYYKKKGTDANINNYKNSLNFVEAVKEARRYENSHEKLIIIAGACQSDYEELIKAGANFASSPKRINIHALDPAIVATKMSMADANQDINLKEIINNTKYQEKGFGGIITKGTMYMGYPR